MEISACIEGGSKLHMVGQPAVQLLHKDTVEDIFHNAYVLLIYCFTNALFILSFGIISRKIYAY